MQRESVTPQEVIAGRCGAVLGRQTVLKDDHFPGCQNKKLTPLIDGAPNFRQVAGLPVYGVAIPTVTGLRNVLDAVGGKTRKALWHSMREEPLVYLNGQPYVLREIERPFSNLELTGITRERVEQMEVRLREDVLAEAEQYHGRVLVSKELDDGQVIDSWEPVHTVQTPAEVYAALVVEGYQLSYVRIPITDEKAPKDADCDAIARRCAAADESTAFLANCQMGRGRTTTAMIIAALVYQRLHSRLLPDVALPSPLLPEGEDDALRRGEYAVIRSLVRVVEDGKAAKQTLDELIDRCAHMQNLREAILSYRRGLTHEADEARREAALHRGIQYLERYFTLCAFAAYVHDPSFTAASSAAADGSFQAWMGRRPELQSILRRLLWRNPMGALTQPGVQQAVSAALPHHADSGEVADAVVTGRAGAVLGAHCILKEEPYPGVHVSSLPVLHEGAPNFRQALPHAVYGVAIATMDGIRAVLTATGAGAGERQRAPVRWYNLREEGVVFINGTPFVLREATRPLANLLEYSGIDAERLELLEERLKQDVLNELDLYRAVLVTRELPDGQLYDVWLAATHASVQTPREVYAELASEGFNVKYLRVPITHNRALKARDLDTLAREIRAATTGTQHIFSCQAGQGRTTMGMIAACTCLRSAANLAAFLPGEQGHANAAESALPIGGQRDLLLQGQWVVVSRLLRLLPGGHAAKQELDAAVDDCAAVVNLRESILRSDGGLLRHKGLTAEQKQLSHDKLQRDALAKGVESLDRYLVLIAFAAWTRLGCPHTFKSWRSSRPEVQQLRHFVRQNPLAALEYSAPIDGGHVFGQAADVDLAIIHRQGTVLAPWTMLLQHFLAGAPPAPSGAQSDEDGALFDEDEAPVPQQLPPRLCRAENGLDKRVMCFATPMLDTLRCFLDDELDAGPEGAGPQVLLTDLREEVVLCINGVPFALREMHSPIQSVTSVGIRGSAVADLEARLKQDVLREAAACGGRILVHRERGTAHVGAATHPTTELQTVVEPFWLNVTSEAAVATTRELCDEMQREGFRVQYVRVPLARTRSAPRIAVRDMDQLLSAIQRISDDHGPHSAFAMVSHTGVGTAGYAMAVTCSFLLTLQSGMDATVRRPSQLALGSSMDGKSPSDSMDERRDIASLIRVLRFGMSAKDIVDRVLDTCAAAFLTVDDERRALLIVATSFMLGRRRAVAEGRPDTRVGDGAFEKFFQDRAELGFLLNLLVRTNHG